MRIWLSYVLLLCFALSGLSGSVQSAHVHTLADTIQQQHTETPPDMPCHSAAKTTNSNSAAKTTHVASRAAADTTHDCCEQPQHPCEGDCCAKHCAAGGALLAAELFRYIRPQTMANDSPKALPKWLFAAEPPPPINA